MTSPHADFARQYGAVAQRAGQRLGVDPSLLLTQWGLETGWGKSVIPGTNNLGNIKDFRLNSDGVTATDNMNGSVDKYRKFATPDDFADHFSGLIERKYPGVIGAGNDAAKFATALKQGGYAEDPDYVGKIVATANNLPKKPGFLESMANFLIPAVHAAQPEQIDLSQVVWDDEPAQDEIDLSMVVWDDETQQNQQPKDNSDDGGFWDGIVMGLRDPLDAGAQMLSRALDDTAVGRGINSVGNALAEYGLVAPVNSSKDVDKIVNQVNERYETGRSAAGRDGFDFARLGGNIASTAPLMLTNPVGATTLGGRVLTGAAQGAGFGALQPVIGEEKQDNFTSEKSSQAALGGLLGGVTPVVTGAIGRVISPKASRSGSIAKGLLDEGIDLTPGQIMGGTAMRVEDKAMSLPILGDAIRSARSRGNEQLNRAVYNRVLEPIGKATKKIGREAVDDVTNMVSQAYDDVLGKVSFKPDAQFIDDIANLERMAQALPAKESSVFNNTIYREVIEPLTKGQSIDGLAFKRIESQLGEKAKNFLKSTDAYQNDVGNALVEVQKALRSALERANPQYAKELSGVNRAFANLVRLQSAAAKGGAIEGIFTPAQLDSVVRAMDGAVRKNSYARGKALLQDISSAAKDRMSSQIPNSGTADRLFQGGATWFISPQAGAALAAGSLPYLPGVNRLTSGLLTARPAGAELVAGSLKKLPPGLIGLLGDYR